MLHIHRAERADALVDALAEVVSDPLPDPFAPEVIAVPTRGMERWLTQRMSGRLGATAGHSDGVCANVEFPFPGHLIGNAVAAASGIDPDADRGCRSGRCGRCSRSSTLVWPSHGWRTSPCISGGARRRRAIAHPGRRFSTLRHVADLFDRYALHRPDMIRAWAGGCDTDGGGRNLPPDAVWQAELWRRLRDRNPAARSVRATGCRLRPAARGPRRSRVAAAGGAVRLHAAPGRPPATCCGRWPPNVRSTCSCSIPRLRCGNASPS